MADVLRIKRRYTGGAAGAPTTLANGELAYNEVDDKLYYGKGNNAGQATSIIPIAGPGMGYSTGGGSSLVSTDDVAPSTPSDGTLWWDSVSGQLYIYYSDGTSNQWISTSNLPAGLPGGPYLAIAGGNLTGALALPGPPPAGGNAAAIYSNTLTLTSGLAWNLYLNAANTGWFRKTGAGTGGMLYFDWIAGGANNFQFISSPTGAADSAAALSIVATISNTGVFNTATGSYQVAGRNITPGQLGALFGWAYSVPARLTGNQMCGFAWRYTPVSTTRLLLLVTGSVANDGANQTITVILNYGTGTAPANGAAAVGTTITQVQMAVITGGQQLPCPLHAIIPVSIGTNYWFDVGLNFAGSTATYFDVSYTFLEV